MLMTVILVKDQVEQGRFAVKPYALRGHEVNDNAAGMSAKNSLDLDRTMVCAPAAGGGGEMTGQPCLNARPDSF
jgi:hypothetical protein